ncbi:hypothetical protein EPUL_006078 [Erysiphe pulchra]|uniref:Ppe family protein n=1 Tax=Erysiphe pulchra TaxID=225359 RepID=A0A2S4PWR0_9PEZI|nr:hypothetical protein EPUL_006078 [Erysiphe pulchra]
MRYVQILSLLAIAQVAVANPIYQLSRAKLASASGSTGSQNSSKSSSSNTSSQPSTTNSTSSSMSTNAPSKDMVMQAAANFAQDVGIVSNAINKMTSMTDQDAIKDTAQRAFNAESDEDNQRQILIAAAGSAGETANRKIQQYTPTVLDGLDAITKDPSPDSVQVNTKMMEDARNPNILPSITQLSNAALDNMGLEKAAPNFKKTTGQSGSSSGTTDLGTGGNNDNANTNNNNNNNSNPNTSNQPKPNSGGNSNDGNNSSTMSSGNTTSTSTSSSGNTKSNSKSNNN